MAWQFALILWLIICVFLACCVSVFGFPPPVTDVGVPAFLGNEIRPTEIAPSIPPPRNGFDPSPNAGNYLVSAPLQSPPSAIRVARLPSVEPIQENSSGNSDQVPFLGPSSDRNELAVQSPPVPASPLNEGLQNDDSASVVAARMDNGTDAKNLPQLRPWLCNAEFTETPIIEYPGYQYIGRGMDQWFTNQYLLGSGKLGIDAVVRSYYVNDQRIEPSGMEATFAAEAALTTRYERQYGDIGVAVGSDFFITQPFDRNMFDTTVQRSYFANFEYRPFDISQLYVEMRKDQFACRVGKMITPFGRYYYPVDTNLQFDAPFIRTECIRKRETGILLSYLGDCLTADVGVINGCDDRDTNSSKGAVGRVGYNLGPFTAGVSGKYQDGIGSENQKEFNNNFGADFCCRAGKWTVSSEILYDEYGFYHPFDPNAIFWEHSIYDRQVNNGTHKKISGLGWYVDSLYRGERWLLEFNYGQYHPQQIGIPQHDEVNHRGIFRVGYDVTERLQVYNVFMLESGLLDTDTGKELQPWVEMVGLQYIF
jgi:hypothetical protein